MFDYMDAHEAPKQKGLYWQIGNSILTQQKKHGWGAKVIDKLSHDLKKSFPDMQGFSPRNLKYMRRFAEIWPDLQFVQQVVAQIPWGANIVLMQRLGSQKERRKHHRLAPSNPAVRDVPAPLSGWLLLESNIIETPPTTDKTIVSLNRREERGHRIVSTPYKLAVWQFANIGEGRIAPINVLTLGLID